MPTTEAYLIRHGLPQQEKNEHGQKLMYGPEAPLSEEGREHVSFLATQLPHLDTLYSSPFTRARETAEIIAESQRISNIKINDNFRDLHYHNSMGMLVEDVVAEKMEPHVDDESLEDMFERVKNGFSDVLSKEKGKKFGIVSHGHAIRLLIWKYLEGQNKLPESMPSLTTYNYPLQAESWVLIFDENGQLIYNHLITREDNTKPGKGKW